MRNTYYGNAHFKKPYEKTQRIVQQPTNIPSQALGAKDFANYPEPLIGTTNLSFLNFYIGLAMVSEICERLLL